jgi:hypothetical protein
LASVYKRTWVGADGKERVAALARVFPFAGDMAGTASSGGLS